MQLGYKLIENENQLKMKMRQCQRQYINMQVKVVWNLRKSDRKASQESKDFHVEEKQKLSVETRKTYSRSDSDENIRLSFIQNQLAVDLKQLDRGTPFKIKESTLK